MRTENRLVLLFAVLLIAAALLAAAASTAQTMVSAERVSRVMVGAQDTVDLRPEIGWMVAPTAQYSLLAWCGPEGGCQWYVDLADGSVREGAPLAAWETRATLLPVGAAIRWRGEGIAYIWQADSSHPPIVLPTWRCLKTPFPGGYEQRCANPWR
jgi:hypothetical protein